MSTTLDYSLSYYNELGETGKQIVMSHMSNITERHVELSESYFGVEHVPEIDELTNKAYFLMKRPTDYWSFYGSENEKKIIMPYIQGKTTELYNKIKNCFLNCKFEEIVDESQNLELVADMLKRDCIMINIPYPDFTERSEDIYSREEILFYDRIDKENYKQKFIKSLENDYVSSKSHRICMPIEYEVGYGLTLNVSDTDKGLFTGRVLDKFRSEMMHSYNVFNTTLFGAAMSTCDKLGIAAGSSDEAMCEAYVRDIWEKISAEKNFFSEEYKEGIDQFNQFYAIVTPGEDCVEQSKIEEACKRFGGIKVGNSYKFYSESRGMIFLKNISKKYSRKNYRELFKGKYVSFLKENTDKKISIQRKNKQSGHSL